MKFFTFYLSLYFILSTKVLAQSSDLKMTLVGDQEFDCAFCYATPTHEYFLCDSLTDQQQHLLVMIEKANNSISIVRTDASHQLIDIPEVQSIGKRNTESDPQGKIAFKQYRKSDPHNNQTIFRRQNELAYFIDDFPNIGKRSEEMIRQFNQFNPELFEKFKGLIKQLKQSANKEIDDLEAVLESQKETTVSIHDSPQLPSFKCHKSENSQCHILLCDQVTADGIAHQALYLEYFYPSRIFTIPTDKESEIGFLPIKDLYQSDHADPYFHLHQYSNNHSSRPKRDGFSQEWSQYLDDQEQAKALEKYWEQNKVACNNPVIENFMGQVELSRMKREKEFSSQKMVQVFRTQNDRVESFLVDPYAQGEYQCHSDYGFFYEPSSKVDELIIPFLKKFQVLPSHPSPPSPEGIELAKAQEILEQILKRDDIPFGYKWNGCNSRAHTIAAMLKDMGIESEKVWISGPSAGDLNQELSLSGHPDVTWTYHVAVAIHVWVGEGAQRRLEKRIIDPSISPKLLTPEEWAGEISPQLALQQVHFPIPQFKNEFQKKTLSYSPSWVYHHNRESFPDDFSWWLERSLKSNQKYLDFLKAGQRESLQIIFDSDK